MVSVDELVSKCLENISNVSPEKLVRHVLSCITERLVKEMKNISRIVVDNGIKYQYMIYLETYDRGTYNDLVNLLKGALDEIANKLPENLRTAYGRPMLVDWGDEKYMLFSKEYVAVKYVLE